MENKLNNQAKEIVKIHYNFFRITLFTSVTKFKKKMSYEEGLVRGSYEEINTVCSLTLLSNNCY